MTDNTKRFALHLLFAAVGAALLYSGDNLALLHIPPTYNGLVLAIVTASASFFRAQ